MTLAFEDVLAELDLNVTDNDFLSDHCIHNLKGGFLLGFGTLTAAFKNTDHDRATEYYKETSLRAVNIIEEEMGYISFLPSVFALTLPPIAKPSETMLGFSLEQDIATEVGQVLAYNDAIQQEDFESADTIADYFSEDQQNFYIAMAIALMEGKGFEIGQRLLIDQFKDVQRDAALEEGMIIEEDELDLMAQDHIAEAGITDKQAFLNETKHVINRFKNVDPNLMARYAVARHEFQNDFSTSARTVLSRRSTPFRPGGTLA